MATSAEPLGPLLPAFGGAVGRCDRLTPDQDPVLGSASPAASNRELRARLPSS